MKAALKYINEQLAAAGINYEFGEWTGEITYPYFTGEYAEAPSDTEDGYQEVDFVLNGFTRETWLTLENAKKTIEDLFNYNTTILEDGSGVDISYHGSLIVPTGDAELKRMQINLKIKIWKV